ncbi:mitotic-spindle organizing protein 2-like [Salvelinus alpinus]
MKVLAPGSCPQAFVGMLDGRTKHFGRMNVAPLAVFQNLKAVCAGQRTADTSMGDSSTASYPDTTTTASSASTEPRVCRKAGREKSREGSSQRVPFQPSATRGQKAAGELKAHYNHGACHCPIIQPTYTQGWNVKILGSGQPGS